MLFSITKRRTVTNRIDIGYSKEKSKGPIWNRQKVLSLITTADITFPFKHKPLVFAEYSGYVMELSFTEKVSLSEVTWVTTTPEFVVVTNNQLGSQNGLQSDSTCSLIDSFNLNVLFELSEYKKKSPSFSYHHHWRHWSISQKGQKTNNWFDLMVACST